MIDRDVLTQKRDELKKLLTDYSEKYTIRSKKLRKCVEFHQLLKEGNNWWMSGLQYIAHMNMEDIQTQEGITRLKTSLDEFMENTPRCEESQIARVTELAHHLGSKHVESAEQVNSKCLEVEGMLQAKKNQILGAEARLKKVCNNKFLRVVMGSTQLDENSEERRRFLFIPEIDSSSSNNKSEMVKMT